MKYKPKPRFDAGFIVADGQSDRKTLVGRLLPQPKIGDGRGGASLLDAWLGDGFALIGVEVGSQDLARIAAVPAIARLAPRIVRLGGAVDDLAASNVTSLTLSSADASALGQAGRVLLVRPDRYVAGAFPPEQAAAFAARLNALLGTAPTVQAASEASALAGAL
jgi:3-(3-hydroxy-phenyl)propionate hydroxylase